MEGILAQWRPVKAVGSDRTRYASLYLPHTRVGLRSSRAVETFTPTSVIEYSTCFEYIDQPTPSFSESWRFSCPRSGCAKSLLNGFPKFLGPSFLCIIYNLDSFPNHTKRARSDKRRRPIHKPQYLKTVISTTRRSQNPNWNMRWITSYSFIQDLLIWPFCQLSLHVSSLFYGRRLSSIISASTCSWSIVVCISPIDKAFSD